MSGALEPVSKLGIGGKRNELDQSPVARVVRSSVETVDPILGVFPENENGIVKELI